MLLDGPDSLPLFGLFEYSMALGYELAQKDPEIPAISCIRSSYIYPLTLLSLSFLEFSIF
jgi:hypothetical protein